MLTQGHEVFCTSRRTNGSETEILDLLTPAEFDKIQWVFCDLLDKNSCETIFKDRQYDGVFHLAAQSHPPTGFKLPFYTQDVNVQGSLNLLEAVATKQNRCRFMFCSTSEVYGAPNLQAGERISEQYPITTVNPYASSKAMIDIFFQERLRNGFMDGFITRAFSHTGPRRGRIFSISSDAYQIAKILCGSKDRTIKVGNLESRRAVMDVRDCVRAYYMLMMSGTIGVFNVGAETCYPMESFLKTMLRMYGLEGEVDIEVDQALWRPIDIPVQIPDVTKLKKVVRWEPVYPLDQTLQDLVDYWRVKIGSSC